MASEVKQKPCPEAARHKPGNAAAMREALVALRDAARDFCHQILNSKYNDIMDEYKCRERGFPALLDLRYAIVKANATISAPARNCDMYGNWYDAHREWERLPKDELGYFVDANGVHECEQAWLFAPAEERKGEGK